MDKFIGRLLEWLAYGLLIIAATLALGIWLGTLR